MNMSEQRYATFKNQLGNICLFDTAPNQGTIFIGKDFQANYLRDRLNSYESEIAALQLSLADLLAVTEAQSEAIGAMRNYIRKVAGNYIYGLEEIQLEDYRQIIEEAQAMVAAWDKPETEVVE
jgi:hypothetical protein